MLTLETEVSNTDPFAAAATPGNQWHKPAPHVMLLMPDRLLTQFPTTPSAGAPYVMYSGTPYAHLMVPIK
jgi:hypothetical protein